MTRDEVKTTFKSLSKSNYALYIRQYVFNLIDEVFDHFEKVVSDLQEDNKKLDNIAAELFKSRSSCLVYIEELEEAQSDDIAKIITYQRRIGDLEESKSCDGCKHYPRNSNCIMCVRYASDRYEPKEDK